MSMKTTLPDVSAASSFGVAALPGAGAWRNIHFFGVDQASSIYNYSDPTKPLVPTGTIEFGASYLRLNGPAGLYTNQIVNQRDRTFVLVFCRGWFIATADNAGYVPGVLYPDNTALPFHSDPSNAAYIKNVGQDYAFSGGGSTGLGSHQYTKSAYPQNYPGKTIEPARFTIVVMTTDANGLHVLFQNGSVLQDLGTSAYTTTGPANGGSRIGGGGDAGLRQDYAAYMEGPALATIADRFAAGYWMASQLRRRGLVTLTPNPLLP